MQKQQEDVEKVMMWQQRVIGFATCAGFVVAFLLHHHILG